MRQEHLSSTYILVSSCVNGTDSSHNDIMNSSRWTVGVHKGATFPDGVKVKNCNVCCVSDAQSAPVGKAKLFCGNGGGFSDGVLQGEKLFFPYISPNPTGKGPVVARMRPALCSRACVVAGKSVRSDGAQRVPQKSLKVCFTQSVIDDTPLSPSTAKNAGNRFRLVGLPLGRKLRNAFPLNFLESRHYNNAFRTTGFQNVVPVAILHPLRAAIVMTSWMA